ncbi:MAG: hypothetical protein WBW71_09550 [Bacteroidota bacterium]
MSVPSSADLMTAIKSYLPSTMKHNAGNTDTTPELTALLQDICDEVTGEWSNWASSTKFGGVTVSGAGIGTWAGSGTGGNFNSIISMSIPHTYNTDATKKLEDKLSFRITAAFVQWSISFIFNGATYSGTSTATTNNPGTFTAQNTPVSLNSAGTVTKFGTLASDVFTDLAFQTGTIVMQLLNAIQSGLQSKFNAWRSASTVTGNSVSGTAVAGTGNGSGTSSIDGSIT